MRLSEIVIVGTGSYPVAPEYGGDTVGAATLERVRWGARRHRLAGLPILVSGGSPFGSRTSEKAGFRVVEAPTGFPRRARPVFWITCPQGLVLSRAVLHEVVGLGWYHVRLASRGKLGQQ